MLKADEMFKELKGNPPQSPFNKGGEDNVVVDKGRCGGDSPPDGETADTPYWLNDLYHAVRIEELHGNDIRYCRKLGGFLIWHGTHWGPDENFAMWRWAVEATIDVWRRSREMPDEVVAPRIHIEKWAKRAERRKHIQDAFMHLRALPGIAVAPDAFDRDPWLFNVQNGTIDLRTGELLEHRREDMITRLSPVVYDPGFEAPARWLQFLSEIFDNNKDMMDFVQRACGYSLSGSVSEQKFFFLHGNGGNGKTAFLNALMHVMGDYAWRMPPALLSTYRRGLHPYAFAELRGCRLAGVADIQSSGRLAGATVKELTGGDRLAACRTRTDYLKFEPSHTLFISGNGLPEIRGPGHAIWRRLVMIPFPAAIPEERQDRGLSRKLQGEASGILNWLVKGCLEWQEHGLAPPAEVAAAADSYRGEMDVLGDFVKERCLSNPDGEVTNPEMRKAYEEWCQRNGERPVSAKALSLGLKERGFVQKPMGHARTRTWLGIELQTYEEPMTEEEYRRLLEIDAAIDEDWRRRGLTT